MPLLVPPTAQGTVAAATDIAGQTTARTIAGLANDIVQSVNNVRVNSNTAVALARRVREMADVVDEVSEDDIASLGPDNTAVFDTFKRALEDLHHALTAQGQRSYLVQLLHQQSDRESLVLLSDKVKDAFNLIVVKLRLRATQTASALLSRIDTMASAHQTELEAVASALSPAADARLPPKPHLYFGRAAETQAALDLLLGDTAGRLVILGGPGIGKTSLAVSLLHDPATADRFGPRRYFVPCDAAEGQSSCFATIANALGIVAKDQQDAQAKIQAVVGAAPSLLVLDNFESAWEAAEQRGSAEEVLQWLDAMPDLSLILTLRGTERPQGVKWSRPFLAPLGPLSPAAAQQTFAAIADTTDSENGGHPLLDVLDNIPLAVVLMANLAQYESTDVLLARWDELHTSMLVRAGGQHRLSSLDVSITVSLHSPRMQAVPAAQCLLSALSLLPHGAVETDIPLWNVAGSQTSLSVLLQNALARRSDKRIYVLAPIRSYILAHYPPPEADILPIYNHYFTLAEQASQSVTVASQADVLLVTARELVNIDAVIRYALDHAETTIPAAIKAVSCLGAVYGETGFGPGAELLPVATSAARTRGLDELCATLLLQRGIMAHNAAASGDPRSLFGEARDIFERLGNVDSVIESSLHLINYLPPADAVDEGRRLYRLAETRNDFRRMARCADQLAHALNRNGRLREAISEGKRAISCLEQAIEPGTQPREMGYLTYHLGTAYNKLGKFNSAIKMYESALSIFEASQFTSGATRVRMQLADLYLDQGRPLDVIRCASPVLAMENAASFRGCMFSLLMIVRAHAMTGDSEAALTEMEDIHKFRHGDEYSISELTMVLSTRAAVALYSNNFADAHALLGAARATARRHDPVETPEAMLNAEGLVLSAFGQLELAQGRSDESLTQFGAALAIFRKLNNQVDIVKCLVLLAECVDLTTSAALIGTVLLPLQRMGLAHDLARALLSSAIVAERQGDFALSRHRARNSLRHFGDIKADARIQVAEKIVGNGELVTDQK